jgi:hypothetical protein
MTIHADDLPVPSSSRPPGDLSWDETVTGVRLSAFRAERGLPLAFRGGGRPEVGSISNATTSHATA